MSHEGMKNSWDHRGWTDGPEKRSSGTKITQQVLDKSWASGSSPSTVVRAGENGHYQPSKSHLSGLDDNTSPQRHKGVRWALPRGDHV